VTAGAYSFRPLPESRKLPTELSTNAKLEPPSMSTNEVVTVGAFGIEGVSLSVPVPSLLEHPTDGSVNDV